MEDHGETKDMTLNLEKINNAGNHIQKEHVGNTNTATKK